MAYKNRTPNLRHRVETIDGSFVIFDGATVTYTICPPGTSRLQAENQCALRNGTGPKKTSESPIHQQFRDKFRRQGVTSQDLAEYFEGQPQERSPGADMLSPKARRQLDSAKRWLPPMLRAWANQIAAQCGYGGARRRAWHASLVMKAIQVQMGTFEFTHSSIRRLHFEVWPTLPESWECHDEIEQRKVVAVHYLSADPDHIKAAYFGISERTYQRELGAAHRALALHLVGARDPLPISGTESHWVDWLTEDADLVDDGDNPNYTNPDAEELASGFQFEKYW